MQLNSERSEKTYQLTREYQCPTDASKVTHTITYRRATCTRVDDTIEHFHCSRDSKCVKCQQNYL